MRGKEFETAYRPVVEDILTSYEGFKNIEDMNDHLAATPADFFALKEKQPYIIEVKGSLDVFHPPGETQKRRLKELLNELEIEGININIALLQIKLRKGEYRICYNEQMNLYFDGQKMPIKPVMTWLKKRIEELKQKS